MARSESQSLMYDLVVARGFMKLRGETRGSQGDASMGRIDLPPEPADGVEVTHRSEIRSP